MSEAKIYSSNLHKYKSEHQTFRLLIVDDDPEFLQVIGLFLQGKGFDFSCLDSPVAAIESIKKTPGAFDALILDINMPQLNGFEVSEKLHDLIPIVMVSSDQESQRLKDLKNFYDAYVDKRSLKLHLVPAIHVALARWHEERKK